MNLSIREFKAMQKRLDHLMALRDEMKNDHLHLLDLYGSNYSSVHHAFVAQDKIRQATDEYSIALGYLEKEF